jgi:hypothetical protein
MVRRRYRLAASRQPPEKIRTSPLLEWEKVGAICRLGSDLRPKLTPIEMFVHQLPRKRRRGCRPIIPFAFHPAIGVVRHRARSHGVGVQFKRRIECTESKSRPQWSTEHPPGNWTRDKCGPCEWPSPDPMDSTKVGPCTSGLGSNH